MCPYIWSTAEIETILWFKTKISCFSNMFFTPAPLYQKLFGKNRGGIIGILFQWTNIKHLSLFIFFIVSALFNLPKSYFSIAFPKPTGKILPNINLNSISHFFSIQTLLLASLPICRHNLLNNQSVKIKVRKMFFFSSCIIHEI